MKDLHLTFEQKMSKRTKIIDLTLDDSDDGSESSSGCQECTIDCRLCGTSATALRQFVRHDIALCGAFLDVCVPCAQREGAFDMKCAVCSIVVGSKWRNTPTETLVRDQFEFAEEHARNMSDNSKTCEHCEKKCHFFVRHAVQKCGATTACCVDCAADWFSQATCAACGLALRGEWLAVNDLHIASAALGKRKSRAKALAFMSEFVRRESRGEQEPEDDEDDYCGDFQQKDAVIKSRKAAKTTKPHQSESSAKAPIKKARIAPILSSESRFFQAVAQKPWHWGPRSIVLREAEARLSAAKKKLREERAWSSERNGRKVRKRSIDFARREMSEANRILNAIE